MTYCTKCGKPTNNGIMCEDCIISDSPWLVAMNRKEDDLVEQIEQLKSENAALRERLDKAVELPVECYSKVWYLNIIPTISLKANTIYEGTLVGYHIVPINGMIYFIAEIRIENEYGVTQLPNAERDYNKTCFTDRAAAEARLAELKGEKE